jgi:hypothetical protein
MKELLHSSHFYQIFSHLVSVAIICYLSAHHHRGDSPGDVRPDRHLVALMLLAVASSFDPAKFCTLLDRDLRCDGYHTTSLHR